MKIADLNTGAGQLRDAIESLRQARSDTAVCTGTTPIA